MTTSDPGALAADYLLAIRDDSDAADPLGRELARLEPDDLASRLADDHARTAFWLDLYNAVVAGHHGLDLTARIPRLRHFRRAIVTVAGQRLSLDAIEHGILRRSRWKLGLGYLGNPVPGRFERLARVERPDPRIHFALNCGAASCPPIAAYRREGLSDQLERATRSYLGSEVDDGEDVLRVPAILLWYLGDFGGLGGVRRLLREHGIDDHGRRLRFRRYDWTPAPGRWSGDEH